MWQAEATTYNWEVNVFPEGLTNEQRNIDAHLIDGDARVIWREAFAMICHEIAVDELVLTMPGEFDEELTKLLSGGLPTVAVELVPVSGQP